MRYQMISLAGSFLIVWHKQDTITQLFESLKNGPKVLLIDKGYISNYLGVNIKKNSDGTVELL